MKPTIFKEGDYVKHKIKIGAHNDWKERYGKVIRPIPSNIPSAEVVYEVDFPDLTTGHYGSSGDKSCRSRWNCLEGDLEPTDKFECFIKHEAGTVWNSFTCKESTMTIGEEKTMKLEEIQKVNLYEAKKKFEEERNNQEIEFAKAELRRLTDKRNAIIVRANQAAKELAEVDQELVIFTGKK